MKSEITTPIKFGVPGLVLGALIALLAGIKSGLLLSRDNAERMAQSAVVAAKAEICVGQFRNGPDLRHRIEEFKRLNFIQRDAFLEKGGWDRMPGEDKASNEVNRACGDTLAQLSTP